MAYGATINDFLLEEFTVQIGPWTTPNLIDSVVDPTTYFTSGEVLGYVKSTTEVFGIKRTYAEADTNTPKTKLRKDLTMKNFMANFNLFNYNVDTMALAMGLLSESAGDYPIDFIGPNEDICSDAFNGYLFSSRRVDCVPIYIAIWYGKITTEDVSITLNGDYSTIPIQIEAFFSPDFDITVAVDREKAYGAIWTDET